MSTTRRTTGTAPVAPSSTGRAKPGAPGGPAASKSGTSTFWESLKAAWRIPDLRARITFVFAMFGVYVIGLHIPIPSINHQILQKFFSNKNNGGNGILSLVDTFSGGALKNFTILALGILPYINASIIMQLVTFAVPQLQELSREGESGRKQISQYTRYLTVFLALLQGCGITILLSSQNIIEGGIFDKASVVVLLMAGTSFLMWIGEMITEKGIGNGVSLIIFAGIMVRLPTQVIKVGGLYDSGSVSLLQVIVLVVAFFATIIGIVYVTLGQRRIPIQHVRRIVGNKQTQGGMSYMPFRVNSAGVIPIIFAVSIQLLPLTFASYVPTTSPFGHILNGLVNLVTPGKSNNPFMSLTATLVYVGIIIFFTYFYTAVMMDIPHIADDLRKHGSYIPGIRPGKPTEDYLDRVMTRITLAGACFLALVALMQYWIPSMTNTTGAFTLVGGTSLLIVVGVALDTMQAIESQLLMRHYEGFIR
jgi:preprotein translocase subunit SecY